MGSRHFYSVVDIKAQDMSSERQHYAREVVQAAPPFVM
jgi:hypothetical protein